MDFDNDDEEENNQDAENIMDPPDEGKTASKKKKKPKKDKEIPKIGAEDTLDMIKNALKGAQSGKIASEISEVKKPSSGKPKKKKVSSKAINKEEEIKEED